MLVEKVFANPCRGLKYEGLPVSGIILGTHVAVPECPSFADVALSEGDFSKVPHP